MLASVPICLARLGIVETGIVEHWESCNWVGRKSQTMAGGKRQGPLEAPLVLSTLEESDGS
eukprot:10995599-Prorocentrum_lima.AAC.1